MLSHTRFPPLHLIRTFVLFPGGVPWNRRLHCFMSDILSCSIHRYTFRCSLEGQNLFPRSVPFRKTLMNKRCIKQPVRESNPFNFNSFLSKINGIP